MTYKPLRTDFTLKNFRHTQLKREGDIAIFKKTSEPGNHSPNSFDAGYEVVIVSRHDGYEIAGNKVEPAETYPGNEAWGVRGWTYTNLEDAEKRFDKLIKAGTQNIPNDSEPPIIESDEPVAILTLNEVKKMKAVNVNLPNGEFTMQELMVFNNSGRSRVYFALQDLIKNGSVVEVRRDQKGKGRATVIYSKAPGI